jgi:hypothetical protein
MAATKKYKTIGGRRDVWDNKALMTSGGLRKSDLTLNRDNKLVSLRKQVHGKRTWSTKKVQLKRRLRK